MAEKFTSTWGVEDPLVSEGMPPEPINVPQGQQPAPQVPVIPQAPAAPRPEPEPVAPKNTDGEDTGQNPLEPVEPPNPVIPIITFTGELYQQIKTVVVQAKTGQQDVIEALKSALGHSIPEITQEQVESLLEQARQKVLLENPDTFERLKQLISKRSSLKITL